METVRYIALIIIFALTLVDLSLTFYYVHRYKQWQPDKPYKAIELNPLLVYLWTKMNLIVGTIIGGIIILSLDYIIVKDAHWIFIPLLICLLIFALFNHYKNINLLHQLIEKYPLGHLPEEVFGAVVGNNPQ